MRDFPVAAQQIVMALGKTAARQLLWLLDQPDEVRADVFRQFHERGTHRALEDALYGLEADSVMRGRLAEYLRLELSRV